MKCGKCQSKDYQEKEESTLSSLSDCIIFNRINPDFRWKTTGEVEAAYVKNPLNMSTENPVHTSSLFTSPVCRLTRAPTSYSLWTTTSRLSL